MSDLGRRLSEGGLVRGVGATSFATAVVETAGDAGMDFVWLDLEHKGPSPADSQVLENLVRAAERVDTELLVRLPNGEPWLVRKTLDAGVSNLVIPRVETASEVRRAIRAAEFVYEDAPGGRGGAVSFASDWGRDGYEPRQESPAVGVMVETELAVENLTDILSVPGLDFTYLGAADLSISLGHPFETDHPTVASTVNSIREQCVEADVALGRSVGDPVSVSDAVEEGYQLLRYADDVSALRRTLSRFEDQLDRNDE